MLCCANTARSWSPKSPPTTATIATAVKELAEIEKCDAEPPNICSRLPNGVSTASNATEPTTSRDIEDLQLQIFDFGLDERVVLSASMWFCAFALALGPAHRPLPIA